MLPILQLAHDPSGLWWEWIAISISISFHCIALNCIASKWNESKTNNMFRMSSDEKLRGNLGAGAGRETNLFNIVTPMVHAGTKGPLGSLGWFREWVSECSGFSFCAINCFETPFSLPIFSLPHVGPNQRVIIWEFVFAIACSWICRSYSGCLILVGWLVGCWLAGWLACISQTLTSPGDEEGGSVLELSKQSER